MVEIHKNDLSPLLNSFNDGVCFLNAKGELLYCNETARKHWNINVLPTYKLALQPPIARALAGEHVVHELLHVESERVLLVNAVPMFAGTTTVTDVVIISHDVSEHVLLEQQAEGALQVLLRAILDTQDTESIDEALRRIAALIPQLEPVDDSIAFRVEEATGRLIPIALYGSNEQNYDEWKAELQELKLSAENILHRSISPYLHSARLARAVMYDYMMVPIFHNPRNLRAAIYAPVFLNGRVVGLVGAERHRAIGNTGTYFPHWSIELLAALARLASMAMEKNMLLTSIKQLQDEKDEIRQLLNQKEEFLLLTAHELKNPLTTIRGMAQVVRRRINRAVHVPSDLSQETHELIRGLESIEHQTRRIEHLINMLLEVSRVDLGRLELELQEVDLVQLAKRTLKDYHPLAPKHELRLTVNGENLPFLEEDTARKPSIFVQADEQRLEQVLINLISNAVKYSPAGGPIITSIRETDKQQVELAVEDRGIGIPPNEQTRLVERFYRATNAQQSKAQGLGLGLYLVNVLVAKHGGSLAVKSEGVPGKGSIFTIQLPRQNS